MSKVTTDVLQKFLYTVRVVDFTERACTLCVTVNCLLIVKGTQKERAAGCLLKGVTYS